MHDPMTVAFEINSPFKDKHGHRRLLVTIWHVDPLKFRFKDGSEKYGVRRDDDTCGWSYPIYTEADHIAIGKLAKQQYSEIFARQVAEAEGKDYAYVCNEPQTTYEVIYWMWRSIKAHGKKGWQYGNARNFLTPAELEFIMQLATNPVDNFKHHRITKESQFVDMFRMIWNQYRRFHRPWYRHPRWHIHHWKVQVNFLLDIRRRYWDKCAGCGKRGFTGSAMGEWNSDKIWHMDCYPRPNKEVSNHL